MSESDSDRRLDRLVEEIEPRRHPVWAWFRQTVPFLVSAAILYYYFRNVDWAGVRDALAQANLWLMVPARVLPLLIYWGLDAFILQRLFGWFDRPMRWRDLFWVRGALYLAMLVNVNISTGGMLLYLLRKTRMGAARLIGVQLFRLGLNLCVFLVLLTAAGLGCLGFGLEVSKKIPLPLLTIILGLGWLWFFHAWTYWQHSWRWWPLNYLLRRDWPLWHAFAQATPRHWLKLFIYSLPLLASNLFGLYLCAWAFQIRIPIVEFLILIPLALSISNLPIAFGGFGTTTLAWQFFFPHYASPDTYLAFTLAYPVLSCLSRAVIGLVSLKPAWSEWNRLAQNREPSSVVTSSG